MRYKRDSCKMLVQDVKRSKKWRSETNERRKEKEENTFFFFSLFGSLKSWAFINWIESWEKESSESRLVVTFWQKVPNRWDTWEKVKEGKEATGERRWTRIMKLFSKSQQKNQETKWQSSSSLIRFAELGVYNEEGETKIRIEGRFKPHFG